MHKLNYFPLGRADCCRVDLANERKLLFDYAATRNPEDPQDKRCDLAQELRDDLDDADRNSFDVVAFSHLDKDHIQGSSEFFWFEHDAARQDDDRVKIDELWVPVGVILEEDLPDDEDHVDHRAVQDEAHHRFRNGSGIRVFGRPQALKEWCRRHDVPLEQRAHLITNAGTVAPGFSTEDDEVEFFVHSPFAWRIDDDTADDRNRDNLILHATFVVRGRATKVLFTADSPYEALGDVVNVTRGKGNDHRLEWHVGKVPHHCSYLSVGPDKGVDRTDPTDEVRWLWEDQQQGDGILVSSSPPIPKKGSREDDDPMPPHRQAANYYKGTLTGDADDDFRVTMEYPNRRSPKPLVILIGDDGPEIDKMLPSIGVMVGSSQPPRAG